MRTQLYGRRDVPITLPDYSIVEMYGLQCSHTIVVSHTVLLKK